MYQLQEFVQATADANGKASVSSGPRKFGETWNVTLFATTTNSVSETQLRIYRGVESDTALVASTYSGNQDTASGNPVLVPSQDKLVFVWTGADPGSICSCRIEGQFLSGRV